MHICFGNNQANLYNTNVKQNNLSNGKEYRKIERFEK